MKADEVSGLLEMINACGIDVQGTVPRACQGNVLPYEMYRELCVMSEGEET